MRLSTLRYLLTARCRDASRVASDECDGPVSSTDWWAARLHWLACRPCRQSRDQLRLIDRFLKSAPAPSCNHCGHGDEQPRLSPAAAARIKASIAQTNTHPADADDYGFL